MIRLRRAGESRERGTNEARDFYGDRPICPGTGQDRMDQPERASPVVGGRGETAGGAGPGLTAAQQTTKQPASGHVLLPAPSRSAWRPRPARRGCAATGRGPGGLLSPRAAALCSLSRPGARARPRRNLKTAQAPSAC